MEQTKKESLHIKAVREKSDDELLHELYVNAKSENPMVYVADAELRIRLRKEIEGLAIIVRESNRNMQKFNQRLLIWTVLIAFLTFPLFVVALRELTR